MVAKHENFYTIKAIEDGKSSSSDSLDATLFGGKDSGYKFGEADRLHTHAKNKVVDLRDPRASSCFLPEAKRNAIDEMIQLASRIAVAKQPKLALLDADAKGDGKVGGSKTSSKNMVRQGAPSTFTPQVLRPPHLPNSDNTNKRNEALIKYFVGSAR